jgi:beta-1,4-mannosyltransferase
VGTSHIRVIASPAFTNEAGNPYNAALYRTLARCDVAVSEYSTKKLLSGKFHIWHLHWPDLLINGPTPWLRLKRTVLFMAKLVLARMHGVKVIWTVHNIKPHDYQLRLLQRAAYWVVLRSIAAFISLSRYAEDVAMEAYPRLRHVRGFVIPHGHYKGLYPDEVTKEEARRVLQIDPCADVYLFFGMIRPYKNLERLIELFREIPNPHAHEERLKLIEKMSTF